MAHFLHELQASFTSHARRPALVHRGATLTYAELEAEARSCAGWLRGLGVEKGDRVVLFTGDKRPFLFAVLGCQWAGAVALPLNPKFTREEMKYFLADSRPQVVVAGAEQRVIVEGLTEAAGLQIVSDQEALTATSSHSAAGSAPGAGDPALMIYSSGTTGWPKGVVHTHANLGSALQALARCWRMTADDVVVNVLPLFHIHGLAFAALMPWLAGACVLVEDSFHAQETLGRIGQGTVFMAVPTIYYRFLEQPEFRPAAKDWGRVRLFTCGSAPIRPEVLPELEGILGRPIINRYGMSEAHVITSLPLDGPWPQGSVGLPLEGIVVQVVREDGTETAPGEVGAVCLRGPNLFQEYWGKPEATEAAFASGWFDTGDLGQKDTAGFLTLVGRKNDLIITNGYNVYPPVVERVINECPGVKESAVLGLPDERRGERVAAIVVRDDPALDEDKLRAWWGQRLIDYQRPLTVMFVDQLPRNAMGKVLRRELREQLVIGQAQTTRPGERGAKAP